MHWTLGVKLPLMKIFSRQCKDIASPLLRGLLCLTSLWKTISMPLKSHLYKLNFLDFLCWVWSSLAPTPNRSTFHVSKKNASYRMILNLKKLNTFVEYHLFKMDSLDACATLMSKNCFMASLDLSDAYYSITMAPCCHKYLKFSFIGVLYHYCCLPNGLSSGPRLFTKLLKPAFAYLREHGHSISGYLDDSFLVVLSEALCFREKSVFSPTLCLPPPFGLCTRLLNHGSHARPRQMFQSSRSKQIITTDPQAHGPTTCAAHWGICSGSTRCSTWAAPLPRNRT